MDFLLYLCEFDGETTALKFLTFIFSSISLVKSNFLKVGEIKAIDNTVNKVMVPPKITAVTGPKSFAATPLSRAQAR